MINENISAEILVIGAGPKAAAIVSKAHVLNSLGLEHLKVTVLERSSRASSWTGMYGYTTGREELGTRPEKDVGFPYESELYGAMGAEIEKAMFEFSWSSYLVSQKKYRRWVDCGVESPEHREFAEYLEWVFEKATNGITHVKGEATSVTRSNAGWRVHCSSQISDPFDINVSKGIVLTGSGQSKSIECEESVRHRVFSPNVFREDIRKYHISNGESICIAGSGESAATMALHLIQYYGPDIDLTLVASSLPSSRAESYLENSIYSSSHLVRWESLPLHVRKDFIARTDRGVMSPSVLAKLTRHKRLNFIQGRIIGVRRSSQGRLAIEVHQEDEIVRKEFDLLANCIGFNPTGQLSSLFSDVDEAIFKDSGTSIHSSEQVSTCLDSAFAIKRLHPRIHVPALAGLVYGPGFANLSCLGLLSDRILSAYTQNKNLRAIQDPFTSNVIQKEFM